MRKADCSVACYTGLERCPAYSGSLVLVLAPLSLQLNSGAIYFSRHEPFASLPPHQDEPDDSDDDQKNLARRDYRLRVHGQPPPVEAARARQSTLRKILPARRRSWRIWGALQVHFRNRESRLVCGIAMVFAQHTWDMWHCHSSRAACAGCVALPRLSRNSRGVRKTLGLKKPEVVDRQGFEPWTLGLKVPCSAS